MHASTPVSSASAAEVMPVGQLVHSVDPTKSAYVPAAQAVHSVDPSSSEYVPAAQSVHSAP